MSNLLTARSAIFDLPFNHTETDYFAPLITKREKESDNTRIDQRYIGVLTRLTRFTEQSISW